MNYLNTVNDRRFREASQLIYEAEVLLLDMGMTIEQAREWIYAWASPASDGSE